MSTGIVGDERGRTNPREIREARVGDFDRQVQRGDRLFARRHALLLQHRRVLLRHFVQVLEPPRLAAVAGAHVGLEQQFVAVGLELAQPGDPFGRLPIGDARIVEAGGHQQRRIGLPRDLIVWGIGADQLERRLVLDRVAPFGPLAGGQRQLGDAHQGAVDVVALDRFLHLLPVDGALGGELGEHRHHDMGGVGGTLAGNPLQVAAMRATLEQVLTEEAFEKMIDLATYFTDGVNALFDKYDLPWSINQLGARAEYRFAKPYPITGTAAYESADAELEDFLHLYLANRGVLLTPFHNMALMCPTTTKADVDRHNEVFEAAIAALVG